MLDFLRYCAILFPYGNTMNNPATPVVSALSLGASIRSRRRSLGFTLEAAAGLCGVGVRFLSELERGKPTSEIGKTLQVLSRLGLVLFLAERGSAYEK
jgi:hypothetical protein